MRAPLQLLAAGQPRAIDCSSRSRKRRRRTPFRVPHYAAASRRGSRSDAGQQKHHADQHHQSDQSPDTHATGLHSVSRALRLCWPPAGSRLNAPPPEFFRQQPPGTAGHRRAPPGISRSERLSLMLERVGFRSNSGSASQLACVQILIGVRPKIRNRPSGTMRTNPDWRSVKFRKRSAGLRPQRTDADWRSPKIRIARKKTPIPENTPEPRSSLPAAGQAVTPLRGFPAQKGLETGGELQLLARQRHIRRRP